MKHRYITTTILMACRAKPRKDIYTLLAETIAERTRLIELWEQSLNSQLVEIKATIHTELEKTIAELRKVMVHSGHALSNAA